MWDCPQKICYKLEQLALHLQICNPEQWPKVEGSKTLTHCEHEKRFFCGKKNNYPKAENRQFSTKYLAA